MRRECRIIKNEKTGKVERVVQCPVCIKSLDEHGILPTECGHCGANRS